ncbi:MAG: TetR/AcrR family transcriptional regulator, partial [Blastomonas fulva]
ATREIVDLAFDAFDREGAGALACWMLLSGNEDALDPIVEAIHQLVDELAEHGPEGRTLHEDTLVLCTMALGDSLMGAQLSGALGLDRDTARMQAERQLSASLALWQAEQPA